MQAGNGRGGLRVGVVGGSVAGCGTAAVLTGLGYHVTIFERSAGELHDRGAGIGMHVPLVEDLKARGLVDRSLVGVVPSSRLWCVKDGGAEDGRIIGSEPMSVETHHWGLLYRQLLARLGTAEYRSGASVARIVPDRDHVAVVLAGGSEHRFDIVVGADGYRSVTHPVLEREATLRYCGYPAWRGIVEESAIGDVGLAADAINAVGTDRGHAVFYLVPGGDGDISPGRRRLNWAWFDGRAPERLVDPFGLDAVPRHAAGLNESQRTYLMAAVRAQMPAWHARVVERTPAPYVQPIFEREARRYSSGRVCLVGDAGSVARPHTGSGTAKAIQDACVLGEVLEGSESPEEALSQYDGIRREPGNALVRLGREMGESQVTSCPGWNELDANGFRSWAEKSPVRRAYYVAVGAAS